MSNLWRQERAGQAASVGSFAIGRGETMFRPWLCGGQDLGDGQAPDAPNIEKMQAEAFAQGFDEGRACAALEHAADREAIARLAEAMPALKAEPTDALAALLGETVERLVRQIVGEVAIDPALLMRRVTAAAKLVGDEVAPSKLRLNPEDAALLDGASLPLPLVEDPALARGSVVIETASGWIEDGPAVRLERLRAELDRIGAL